ncbi:hypothetical protein ASE67_17415 [Sphingomonas sp. Leaf23]|nr:hypothetical protein ASE67_17415 [Sphingomonas sp. Leaf23]
MPAAILDEEQCQRAQAVEIGAVDDRPAMTLGMDQSRAGENAEVRRHGVLRHVELTGYFTGRQSGWFMADKQAKHIETRSLC